MLEIDGILRFPLLTKEKIAKGDVDVEIFYKDLQRSQDCSLFKAICSPDKPFGPCMVSSEGPCAIFYKYGGLK